MWVTPLLEVSPPSFSGKFLLILEALSSPDLPHSSSEVTHLFSVFSQGPGITAVNALLHC